MEDIVVRCIACGRPLKKLNVVLDDEDLEDILFIINKEEVSAQSLRPDQIPAQYLNENQTYEYLRAVIDSAAEAAFLHRMWDLKIRNKYRIKEKNYVFQNYGLYVHSGEE